MLMHHFDCIWLLLNVAIHFGRLRTPGFHRISVWRISFLLWATRQATLLIIPITPMFLLLHLFIALGSNASTAFATIVEPTSFAWLNLVTVNSRTLQPSIPGSCLSYDVPYPAMHAMLRVVYGLSSGRWTEMWECVRWAKVVCWTWFGKGTGERLCRSTWRVVSLEPSLGTEFRVCNPRLDTTTCWALKYDPARPINRVVLGPGVASSFWCL